MASQMLTALRSFAQGPLLFQILQSFPPQLSSARLTRRDQAKTLYILDSSFNPPTLAHLRLCTTALLDFQNNEVPKRLLLLLATQNADKAPKPAAFEQRLAMMSIFAQDLIKTVKAQSSINEEGLIIDVGVTKLPRFVEKVKVIEESSDYAHVDGDPRESPQQVHLIGFDTLVRLFDTKYYPPDHTLKPLEILFAKHRVRATLRTLDGFRSEDEQHEFLFDLLRGGREE